MKARERYHRLADLFDEARALDSGARLAFLDRECEVDRSMAREVLELLEQYDDPAGPLPPWESGAGWTAQWNLILDRLHRHRARESRYRIEARLDRGGQGVLYRIWDEDLARPLAMKVTLAHPRGSSAESQGPDDERTLGRFLDEARITARLDHPGVVPVHELGVDNEGRVYFTMRLVHGRHFGEVIRLARRGEEGWTVNRALECVLHACEAMAYAHAQGVIHRDLKPRNIMVGSFGETYVLDWGLGRFLDEPDSLDLTPVSSSAESEGGESELRTRDGDVLGTPCYMPPEQARGDVRSIREHSDVYSMGAILYELLTGGAPYEPVDGAPRPHAQLVVSWIRETHPAPIHEIDRSAPPELVAICERAMARDPEDRLPGMKALASELRAYLEKRVVPSYATGPLVELRKWILRNPLVAASVAALISLMIGTAFIYASKESQRLELVQRNRDEHAAENLVAELERSWVLAPDSIPAMESWIEEVQGLVDRLPRRREELLGLEAELGDAPRVAPAASPLAESRGRELEIQRNYLEGFTGVLDEKRGELAALGVDDDPRGAELRREITIIEGELRAFAQRVEELDAELERTPSSGRSGQETALQLAGLEQFVSAVERLDAATPGVQDRLAQARAMVGDPDAEIAARWSDCLDDIGDVQRNPHYDGLIMVPQHGLVPLRRDPSSGLWEFWHRASGAEPAAGSEGEYDLVPESGIVLVLIPGGTCWLGAQSTDAGVPNYLDLALFPEQSEPLGSERPVHEVTLAPYFLSKYELTQAQWHRLTGASPSLHFAGASYTGSRRISRTHPVDHVSFDDCEEALALWGLEVPTEAQWECAARAGAQGPYTSPGGFQGIVSQVNFADVSAERRHLRRLDPVEIDDGYDAHAPVDAFTPNPNGLHGMVGNVWEWCRDWTDRSRYLVHDIDPESGEHGAKYSRTRSIRGGSFLSPRADLRLSRRIMRAPAARHEDIGVRPGRALAR